jgi:hypothetical protein
MTHFFIFGIVQEERPTSKSLGVIPELHHTGGSFISIFFEVSECRQTGELSKL